MKGLIIKFLGILTSIMITAVSLVSASPADAQSANPPPISDGYAFQTFSELPLLFIQNRGQLHSSVHYYVKGQGQTVFLTNDGLVFDASNSQGDRLSYSLNFVNANHNPLISGENQDSAVINYLIGTDPADWKTNVPTFRAVVYQNVYPGIDMRLYGDDGALRYDFVVEPGASVDNIALVYNGIEELTLVGDELVASSALGDSRQQKPFLYQQLVNTQTPVEGGFKLLSGNSYGFETGEYDRTRPLIIDPTFTYSSYLGGSGDDSATSVAFGGPTGYIFVGGNTTSPNFPVMNGYQVSNQGGAHDAFIAVIDASLAGASSLIYCTYIGGSGDDLLSGVGVNPSGNVYLTGSTTSANFPMLNAYQGIYQGGAREAFFTRLLPGGNGLSYSTYLGGSGDDSSEGITVDPTTGIAYITGSTTSPAFPLKNAYQTTLRGLQDSFVSGINPVLNSGASLIYSSYLGGSSSDIAHGIAMLSSIDNVRVFIGGETTSLDFPTKVPPDTSGKPQHVMQDALYGTQDGFVASFFTASSDAASLYYSSYLGGAGRNSVTAVGLCDTGCLYVTGWTDNEAFPVTDTAPPQTYQGGIDGFFSRISPDGHGLYFSTYLGGSADDYPTSMNVDYHSTNGVLIGTGDAVIAGYTSSSNFPITKAAQSALNGQKDTFVVRVNPYVLAPFTNFKIFSSYLGGSGDDIGRGVAVDTHGGVIVVGETSSTNFPVQNPYQPSIQATNDAFITRIGEVFASVTTGNASLINATSARLNGNLISQGTGWGAGVTQVSFEWGSAPGIYANLTPPQAMPTPALGAFSADISGLTPGSTYYFRSKVGGNRETIYAGADGTSYGIEKSFVATPGIQFSLNASVSGTGGTISPAGNIAVNSGANQTFTITPAVGYSIASLTVDGAMVTAASSYTFSNVTADHAIVAAFAPIPPVIIKASVSGQGGTISPSGEVPVTPGANQIFTITPITGYGIGTLTVDGAIVTAATTYTFTNVGANHNILVTFTTMPTFTINASVSGAGGTISPNGEVIVNSGASQTFTITPISGYSVSDLTVDGATATVANAYTFSDVVANHNIVVTFSGSSDGGGGGSGSSGGGGGGGGGSYSPPPGYTDLSAYVDHNGIVSNDATARSNDNKVVLNLSTGTKALTAGGSRATSITITPRSNNLAPPPGCGVIGLPYNFSPEGVTFDPGASVTMSYAGLDLAAFNENNLAFAYWDNPTGQWVKLSGYKLDTINKTVTASITHFSIYGILGYPPAPAAFTISNLVVTPASVAAGKDVTVTIDVTNTGELSGVYSAALMAGAMTQATKDVTVKAGETQQVSFIVNKAQAGIYILSIGSLTGSFASLKPAAFTVSDLVVSPASAQAGKDITVSFQVVNTGETSGTYTAALKISDGTEATRDITLAGGENQTATFIVNRYQPGPYTVNIGELSGSFTILAPVVITTGPGDTILTQTASASAAAVTNPGANLWWWVAGILAVGFLVIVLVNTRKRNRLP